MKEFIILNNSSFKLNLSIKYFIIFFFSLSSIFKFQSQTLPTEDLFDFESIDQQKNIKVSERIKEEWNLQNSFIQQTYYNANKDSQIDSVRQIKQVLSIHYLLNNTRKILELLDDGKHFDNKANDGIFGNILVGEFSEFRTDESIIDIHLDTIGINYSILYPPVNYLPEIPSIIVPQYKSIVSSEMPEISWKIDQKADGCGLILLDSTTALGEDFKGIIWEKVYNSNHTNIFNEKIPIPLLNDREYTLILWSYTNTKRNNDEWNRGAYSIELSKFYLDTSYKNEDLILSQNFPNPFSSITIIKYSLPQAGRISIKIYDIIGREINTLIYREQSEGEHYILWDGKDSFGNNTASGVYFYSIKFNNHSVTRKLILTR